MIGCYAIAFDNGTVKFGKSTGLHARIKTHLYNAKIHGVSSVLIMVSPSFDIDAMEARVVKTASSKLEKVSGEYFNYDNIDEVRSVMASATGGYFAVETCKSGGLTVMALIEDAPSVPDDMVKLIGTDDVWGVVSRKVLDIAGKRSGVTEGVLCSMVRKYPSKMVASVIDKLSSDGLIRLEYKKHPRNGSVVRRIFLR